MKTLFFRLIGILLIVGAIGGLIFSIATLVIVWRVQPTLSANLQNTIGLLSATLETTGQGLEVTQQALKSSVLSVKALQSTIESTAMAIESAIPLVDKIAKILEEDLPNTIQATQASLNTAQESAKVIDSLLGTLSSLPLIGSSLGYNPNVPLNAALGDVASSINDLPNSFLNMSDNLQDTGSDLEVFTSDVRMLATSIGEIEKSVAQYETVISGYQESLAQLQAQLETLSDNIPQIVRMLSIGVSIFMIWLAIAQIGLFTQGVEWLSGAPFERRVKPEEAEIKSEPKETSAAITEVETKSEGPQGSEDKPAEPEQD
jgi:peptidoglycan hydrolase CwlO-like protein